MSVRGKEVLQGQLRYRRKGASSYKKRVVTAYCGTGVGANGKSAVAQLTLNEVYEKVEKPGQKPKNVILLEGANIDCSYISGSNQTYSSAGRLSASPSPSPHSSSQGGSGSGIISGSGSGSGTITSASNMHPFSITTKSGDIHEFLSESENDRLRWVKLLQLLLMFPFSTIPEEPKTSPIKESLRNNLDPKRYGADSVWPVYILPEEVGARCGIIGVNVVALKSGKKDVSIGHLDIYNPGDPSTPLISWDRDKMRRTGKTGHLVFIEIGRRCQGGPGLVWMYTGFNEAQALRETLHNFLFKGDGRAVAIPTQSGAPIYDVPRSSFDSNLPPSYKRHNSIPGYNNHVLSRSRSQDQDSGYPNSPISTPPQLDGPPVRLDKHPSIRRKSGTHPRDISRSNSTTSFGSFSERDMSYPPVSRSRDSAEPSLDGDGSSDNSRSTSPQDEDEGVIGQMDPDQLPNSNAAPYYDSVPRRTSSDGGMVNAHQRIVESGGEDPSGSHYELMMHPKNGMQNFDGYVFMKPAENGRATSAPIPVASRNVPLPDDTYHHLQRRPSPQNSSSPRSRSNYDQLPTISERSNYENHPLPRDLKGMSIDYRPSYENVEKAKQGRRGSMNQEVYENVDGERNWNTNNGNSGGQKRTPPLQRRFSERGSASRRDTMSPMKAGNRASASNIEDYLIIESKSESSHVNSTLPAVRYASIDYQSTEAIGTMRSQRQLHTQAVPQVTGGLQ